MVQNKALIFKKIPQGLPVPGQDLAVESREFDLEQAPPVGGITTRNFYASFDPYQRGRMRSPEKKSYSPPFELGAPIGNNSIAKVLKSDNAKLKAGDIGKPKKGETIFVSAASGAVGQLVGQLAKHEGLRVIGSVGSDEKLDFIVNELKFDGAFNYKKEKPLDALRRLAPDGIDIYYENVGGEQLEAAIEVMNNFGRIVACGMVSEYNSPPEARYGVKNLMHIVAKRITFRGFIVGDENMGPLHFEERNKNVSKWLHDGTFKAKMSVTEGIDNAPEGFVGMLQGKNFGKAVLKIADPE
ncbi:NADP-dependent leukotriene B4 12-hydroxydehydrogenase [Diplocarpon rosae]|nr:NADP-dependent leukotriene B4 12-hydroxydehydrogenase [Diplocarpon rosae]